jgi:ATP dependent DNA ligase domain
MPPPSRALPAGFIAPCLPTSAPQPPSGEAWLHEIKHDGFRLIARKDGGRVKLYSRPGNDLTDQRPLPAQYNFRSKEGTRMSARNDPLFKADSVMLGLSAQKARQDACDLCGVDDAKTVAQAQRSSGRTHR